MALTVEDVRLYTKDIPELNILLDGQAQSDDSLTALAMRLAVGDFNSVAPVTTYHVADFPNDTVLLYGTLHHLCNSEAERQLRNQMNYSAQGLNAGLDDKMPQYNQLSGYYKQLFDAKVREYKGYLNAQQAWGDSYSPYVVINDLQYRG